MITARNIVQISIAALALCIASLAIGWGTARAQEPPGSGGFGGGALGPPRAGGAFQPMPPMGPVAITADAGNLFVVRGNEVLKVQESSMQITGRAQLGPRPGPPQGGSGGGGFGGGGGSRVPG